MGHAYMPKLNEKSAVAILKFNQGVLFIGLTALHTVSVM